MKKYLLLILPLLLASAAPTLNITGTWFGTSFVTAPPQRPVGPCALTDTLVIAQTGTHFVGTASGTMWCPGFGQVIFGFSDSVVRGVVHGNTIDFDFKPDTISGIPLDVAHQTAIVGDNISGTAIWVIGHEPMIGSWVASQQ